MELFVVIFKVFRLLVSGRIIHADKLRRKRKTFFCNSNRNSNGISMDTTDCCFHDLTKAKLKHEDTCRGEGLYRKVEGWQGSPYALTKSQYPSARSRKSKDPKSASQMQHQQWLVFGPQSRGHIASSLVMA